MRLMNNLIAILLGTFSASCLFAEEGSIISHDQNSEISDSNPVVENIKTETKFLEAYLATKKEFKPEDCGELNKKGFDKVGKELTDLLTTQTDKITKLNNYEILLQSAEDKKNSNELWLQSALLGLGAYGVAHGAFFKTRGRANIGRILETESEGLFKTAKVNLAKKYEQEMRHVLNEKIKFEQSLNVQNGFVEIAISERQQELAKYISIYRGYSKNKLEIMSKHKIKDQDVTAYIAGKKEYVLKKYEASIVK